MEEGVFVAIPKIIKMKQLVVKIRLLIYQMNRIIEDKSEKLSYLRVHFQLLLKSFEELLQTDKMLRKFSIKLINPHAVEERGKKQYPLSDTRPNRSALLWKLFQEQGWFIDLKLSRFNSYAFTKSFPAHRYFPFHTLDCAGEKQKYGVDAVEHHIKQWKGKYVRHMEIEHVKEDAIVVYKVKKMQVEIRLQCTVDYSRILFVSISPIPSNPPILFYYSLSNQFLSMLQDTIHLSPKDHFSLFINWLYTYFIASSPLTLPCSRCNRYLSFPLSNTLPSTPRIFQSSLKHVSCNKS